MHSTTGRPGCGKLLSLKWDLGVKGLASLICRILVSLMKHRKFVYSLFPLGEL